MDIYIPFIKTVSSTVNSTALPRGEMTNWSFIHQLPTTGSYLSGTIRSGYTLSYVIYFYHTLKLQPLETLTWMEKTLKVLVPGEITLVTIIPLSNHTLATRKDLPPLYKKPNYGTLISNYPTRIG